MNFHFKRKTDLCVELLSTSTLSIFRVFSEKVVDWYGACEWDNVSVWAGFICFIWTEPQCSAALLVRCWNTAGSVKSGKPGRYMCYIFRLLSCFLLLHFCFCPYPLNLSKNEQEHLHMKYKKKKNAVRILFLSIPIFPHIQSLSFFLWIMWLQVRKVPEPPERAICSHLVCNQTVSENGSYGEPEASSMGWGLNLWEEGQVWFSH